MGMATSVVFDAVAAAHDITDDRWMRQGLFSNAKKAGLSRVAVQQIEHVRGNPRVRPIVKGKRYFVPPHTGRGQARDIGSE
jgi:hypothetical protein